MIGERMNLVDNMDATVLRGGIIGDEVRIKGTYTARCYDANGRFKWADEAHNTVVTLGKNEVLDEALAGSSYTAAAYMGLISSVGYSTIAAGDTMSSHAGWAEAGVGTDYPLYTGDRKTCVWSAASSGSKALSAALSFVCATTGGTVKGGFIVFGASASATKGDTGGVLLSAGLFSGGDKILGVGDTLQISYSLAI